MRPLKILFMGLFDFIDDIPIVGDAIQAVGDSLGLTQHGRDQYVNQQNQRDLMDLQNQYNREMFNYQFQQENAEFDRRYDRYQSPQSMVRQYSEAGLNPSALVGSRGAGLGGASGSLNAPVPNVGNLSVASQPNPSSTNFMDYLDAASKLKLNTAQKDEIYALLQNKMREQDDQHQLASIMKLQQTWQYTLDKAYGSDERAQKLANLAEEGLVLYLQGQEAAANSKFLEAKKILANDEHVLNHQQLPLLKLYLEAMIMGTHAKASADYAQSGYYRALSATENAIREFNVNLSRNEATLSSETLNSRVDEIISKAKAAKILPQQVEVELEKAKKENNIYYIRAIIDMISEGVSTVGMFYGPAKIGKAMDVRNSIEAEYKKFMMENNVEEHVVDKFSKTGKLQTRTHSYGRRRPQK